MDRTDELFAAPGDDEYETYTWGWGTAGLAGPLTLAGLLALIITVL